MNKLILSFLVLYTSSITLISAQSNCYCSNLIKIPEFNLYLNWLNINNDTIIKISGNKEVRLHFFSCQGDNYFQELDSNHKKIMEGTFCKSLDTLKEYFIAINPSDPYDEKTEIMKYFEPLKSGIWLYYNEKQEIYKKEIWYQGVKL